MSKQDEFDDLIKNFKLDDVTSQENVGAPQKPRRMFNYEEDAARPMRTAAMTASRAVPRSEQPPVRRSEQAAKQFRVKIDDEEFYEPSSARPAREGAGGGSDGGGKNRGRRREDDEEPPSGGVGRWAKALVVLVIVLAVSIFLAFFALASASDMFGLNKPDQPITFALAKNPSISEVASSLKEEGVITQPLVFRLYAGFKYKGDALLAGNYELNSNMSYDQILTKFTSKRGAVKKEVKLLFIEGMTLEEIGDKLEKSKVVSKKELFDYLQAGDFPWNYKFLKQPLPTGDSRYLNYEGYFFPDTYIFTEDMTPAEVTMKFFSNLNGKIGDELYAQMEKMDMTLDETITLASIIQKEAGKKAEMGRVSSVFHNRLNHAKTFPHLDSDVTSFYVAYDIMPAMGENVKDSKDGTYKGFKYQKMYEAYDTYACAGLPAGAICNPGLDAIEAALNPDKTEHYFFVTDADGKYYYANTSAEHDKNVAVAMPKGDAHGTGVGSGASEVPPAQ